MPSPSKSNTDRSFRSIGLSGVTPATQFSMDKNLLMNLPPNPRANSPTRLPRFIRHQASDSVLRSRSPHFIPLLHTARLPSPTKHRKFERNLGENTPMSPPTCRKSCLRDGLVSSPKESTDTLSRGTGSSSSTSTPVRKRRSASVGAQAAISQEEGQNAICRRLSDLGPSSPAHGPTITPRTDLSLSLAEADGKDATLHNITMLPSSPQLGEKEELKELATSEIITRGDATQRSAHDTVGDTALEPEISCACNLHPYSASKHGLYDIYEVECRFMVKKTYQQHVNGEPIVLSLCVGPSYKAAAHDSRAKKVINPISSRSNAGQKDFNNTTIHVDSLLSTSLVDDFYLRPSGQSLASSSVKVRKEKCKKVESIVPRKQQQKDMQEIPSLTICETISCAAMVIGIILVAFLLFLTFAFENTAHGKDDSAIVQAVGSLAQVLRLPTSLSTFNEPAPTDFVSHTPSSDGHGSALGATDTPGASASQESSILDFIDRVLGWQGVP